MDALNRADLLYEVLRDGRPHSRREVFDRVGYMLTNNAASELRARGFAVEHSKEGRVDVYRLLDQGGNSAEGTAAPALIEQPDSPVSRAGCSPSAPVWLAHGPATSPSPGGSDSVAAEVGTGAVQLSIDDALTERDEAGRRRGSRRSGLSRAGRAAVPVPVPASLPPRSVNAEAAA